MKRVIHCILILLAFYSPILFSDTYTIEDDFDGCEHGKAYELTSGQSFVCEEYQYFYEYRPRVVAVDNKVVVVGDEEMLGRIVDGQQLTTRIDGEPEGDDICSPL